MTLIELLVFIFLIGVGVAAASLLGTQIGWIGYPIGFIGGVASLIGIVWFLGYLETMWRVGRPAFPDCRNGKCIYSEYRYKMEDGNLVCRCKCGDQYEKNGRHFYFVDGEGTREPYLIWRSFDGWYPDNDEK